VNDGSSPIDEPTGTSPTPAGIAARHPCHVDIFSGLSYKLRMDPLEAARPSSHMPTEAEESYHSLVQAFDRQVKLLADLAPLEGIVPASLEQIYSARQAFCEDARYAATTNLLK
jgi:hypothetical protein